MTYTPDEVIEAVDAFGTEDFVEDILYSNEGTVQLESIETTAALVDSKPGREGGGANIWVVFKVGAQLFKLTGYYDSWNGSDWNEGTLTEVQAVERVITDYVAL